jgi:large subunit ribosomal protein L2
MASVGKVSNEEHGSIPIGSAWRKRWLGIRPRSGLKKKKTGYHGKKIRPLKPNVVYDKPKAPKQEIYRFTV